MSSHVQKWGHAPPKLLTATLLPISFTLIIHPLLPLLPLPNRILSPPPTFPALQASVGFALLAFVGAVHVVPRVSQAFVDKGLRGRDLCKPGGRVTGPWVPECLGLPIACWYIGLMMMFIPFPFSHIFSARDTDSSVGREAFPQTELTLYLSSLLSLLTATLLGFIDDLFDIRWRHKLPIPLVAAVPTLLVYYAEGGLTSVVLPGAVSSWIRSIGLDWGEAGKNVVDLGPIYYIYLLLLPTFTTNSINILAGINGVEALQALIIALSIALNDVLYLPIWPHAFLTRLGFGNPHEGRLLEWAAGEVVKRHLLSLYFVLPLAGVCAGFLWHNWYPARAFPGDTLCYFAGMAFSAVAIQGHYTKTLILFFIPQIFNFVLSVPQLFGLVDCPRHRLPLYDSKSDLLRPSLVHFEKPPPLKTKITLETLALLGLVHLERSNPSASRSDDPPLTRSKRINGSIPSTDQPATTTTHIVSSTNLTILNFLLVHCGPLHEQTLCLLVGAIQIACSGLAFGIRYGLGSLVYGGDRR
ncbi:glycosyl transferase family 4-domain-containing protein [Naematelia encephala]|uniref:UDP-N-acetylglucosamine--dolichyl-phosphate N-acetylglucosaminephosphotransferase n=1 Tax=Naematelia encephala TaxID=71784 RepID=A0A1Y2BHE4_9TREE|nr:glycosyl transferase family 4-domain-containing protein [Naematelia encephala]